MRMLWLAALLAAGCTSGSSAEDTNLELTFPDDDLDGILDIHEGEEDDDFDGDGLPNRSDPDSDGDGLDDALEAGDDELVTLPVDSDADGAPDFLDLDSDDNCILDAIEGADDSDLDGAGDFGDLDDDGDLLLDTIEIGPLCAVPDTDGDGTPDHLDFDSDGDGIGDLFEGGVTPFDPTPVDTDGDGTPDYLDLDSDDDGYLDSDEQGVHEPFEPPRDTDGDGIGDYADADSDGDGLRDDRERDLHGTDPYDDDTDDDGFSDGSEIGALTDPTDKGSIIDGIYVEVPERTDVTEQFSFHLEVEQGDIAFLLDSTCSMQGLLNAMASEFSRIVTDLDALIPDAEFGVGTFEDYYYSGMGHSGDKPFRLKQQITSDSGRVQNVLNGLPRNHGGDEPESTMEALYQALTGVGYDQSCNGSFQTARDVKPFLPHPNDAFGGTEPGIANTTWPGGGSLGGMGFRDTAMPIIVYATDASLRSSTTNNTPGGCPGDASGADVSAAALALGAKLVGISVDGPAARAQMANLADNTESFADLDGGGVPDDRLVFTWTGSSASFRNTVVQAIDDLVGSVRFEEVRLEVAGDDPGFVIGIEPQVHYPTGAISGEQLDFTLTFRGAEAAGETDQLHLLTLNVIGDGSVLLDSLDIFVLVPGTTL